MTYPALNESTTLTSPHILVMSESPGNVRMLCGLLTARPCHPEVASSEADALLRVRRTPRPDLVLLELNNGRYSLRTLQTLHSVCPDIDIVIISAPNQTRTIVDAIRLGARDCLTIPFADNEWERVIGQHERGRTAQTFGIAKDPVEDLGDGKFFAAASTVMRKICIQAEQLAGIDVPVLILGESGSGKEVVARLIHKFSTRSREPFLKVNCAALPSDLLQCELFGYEPKAFTGTLRTKPGSFELCDRGTILLDEIAEMPAGLQTKLLHILQKGQFVRRDGEHTVNVDVRILAAASNAISITNCKIREDVYYQLSAFVIEIPPLRERHEDIPVLLGEFMARLAAQYSRPPVALSRTAIDACLNYPWPGNLRELKKFVKRYLVMGEEAIEQGEMRLGRRQIVVGGAGFQKQTKSSRQGKPADTESPMCNLKSIVRDLKDEAEIRAIKQALHETGWNRKRAARLLDISYRGLLYKIQQHALKQDSELRSSTFRNDSCEQQWAQTGITPYLPEEQ